MYSQFILGCDRPELLIGPAASEQQVAQGEAFVAKADALEHPLGCGVV
jgi:hypothetical protein